MADPQWVDFYVLNHSHDFIKILLHVICLYASNTQDRPRVSSSFWSIVMDNMHIKVNRQPALAGQVADILQKEISASLYAPGDVFPSENELAKRLDVSRTVIREALAHLKYDGILESRQGGRTRVSTDLSQRVFRLDKKGQEEIAWIGHLYELRLIVESEAAALAAKRATKKDFQKIKKSFRAFEEAIESGEDGYQESKEFHRSILEASGNPHLSKLVEWIDVKIRSRPREAKSNNRVTQSIHKEHMALIQAIEERAVGKARKTAQKHAINAARRYGIYISAT